MAVAIDELQVETQMPGTAEDAPKPSAMKQRPQIDLKAELQKIQERSLRLRAD
jgi:hypothetical protein